MPVVLITQLQRFTTMATGGRLQFDTGELSPNEFLEVGKADKKSGLLVFYPDREDGLSEEEHEELKKASSGGLSTSKRVKTTKSQRLRAVFYKMWEQDDEGFANSEDHYNFQMERIIKHFKAKLGEDEE